jgi:hypothetical protein
MKIDRTYRNSTDPAPFLQMRGDMPAFAALVVDPRGQGEAYITIPPEWAETPEGLKIFPWHPCLTIRGIDQALETPGILEALQGVLEGRRDSEDYLWEVLGNPDFYSGMDVVYPMEPQEYFEEHPPRLLEGESLEEATERIVFQALEEHKVVLDPLITVLELEEALWM